VSSRLEAKYYTTALRVRGSVRASDSFGCIGVGTARKFRNTCVWRNINLKCSKTWIVSCHWAGAI